MAEIGMHEGLPLICLNEFEKLIKHPPSGIKVVDFQGYLKSNTDDKPQYVDLISTKGLRDGIEFIIYADGHFLIETTVEGKDESSQNPSTMKKYTAVVRVPTQAQKNENIVCTDCNDCETVKAYMDDKGTDYGFDRIRKEIEEFQGKEGIVEVILHQEPTDPQVREKLLVLNTAVAKYISEGNPLIEIKDFITEASSYLKDPSVEPDNPLVKKLLPEQKTSFKLEDFVSYQNQS